MKIVTDCAADMPNEQLRELNVAEVPLFITFPTGEINSTDISADDFYNRLEAMRPAIPTTAQPSPEKFAEVYRDAFGNSDDKQILSIHISSGLSGTLNGARLGAQQVADIGTAHVWDSFTLSGAERFQVMAAALAARKGWSLEQIQARLTDIRTNTEVIYTLETLEYLARGGRIGRVQALAGSLLSLKPVIHVDRADGKYSNVGRARTIPQAIGIITEHLHAQFGSTPVWVTLLHGRIADKADALGQSIAKKLNVAKSEVLRISPVLGVHTGPGIVGAAVAPVRFFEDLQ